MKWRAEDKKCSLKLSMIAEWRDRGSKRSVDDKVGLDLDAASL